MSMKTSNIFECFQSVNIKESNEKLIQTIKKFSSYYISENNLEILNDDGIQKNFEKSKIIMINYFNNSYQNTLKEYFVVVFQNTILIIDILVFTNLQNFFGSKNNLVIYFFSDSKNIFNQKIHIEFIEICKDENFEYEISSFYSEICFKKTSDKEKWRAISTCIFGYLLKESYQKLNQDRIIQFLKYNPDDISEIEVNEKDYVELRNVYSGNISAVVLVYHIEQKELFIIKKPSTFDIEYPKLNKREKENYLNLIHPFLAKYHGTVKNKKYLLIEFINGSSLTNIKSMHLSNEEKITIIFELMVALLFLHQKGYIYRDLKPSNVMVDENKNAVLIDFDRTISFNEVNSCSADFSLYFTPPEIQSNNLTNASDVYSLGKMIFYIMCETEPNSYSSNQHVFDQYPTLLYIHNCCIKNNPNERPLLSKIILEFYLAYHSQIRINNFIENAERFFSGIYDKFLIKVIKNINKNLPEINFNLGVIFYTNKYISRDIEKAIHYFKIASEQVYPMANFTLGIIYYSGQYITKNLSEAIHYFSLAINQNILEAQYYAYYIYYEKLYDELIKDSKFLNNFGSCFEKQKNYLLAKEFYEQSAKNNDSKALFNLGYLYGKGLGVEQNYLKAKEFYEKSAKLNNSEALYHLGLYYEKGLGVDQSYSKAKEFYEKSAKLKNSDALICLGYLYEEGLGVEQNYLKAKEFYEESAQFGNANSYINLGFLYENYFGNYRKAKKYYKKSAKYSNETGYISYIFLGYLYENGLGTKQNYIKAKYCYEESSKFNYSTAYNNLGNLYLKGHGVEKDYLKAKEYYEKSVDLNDPKGFINLANLYENGLGVQKDYLKAKEYYEESIKLGDSDALVHLGIFYEKGYGGKKDFLKAKLLYEKSAQLNNKYAYYNLGCLYDNGFGVEKNYFKAKEYFEKSAQQNSSFACCTLGNYYEMGLGCEQDFNKAKKYYEQSAKLNNPTALNCLGNLYENGLGVSKDYLMAKQLYEKSSIFNNSNSFFNLAFLYKKGLGVKQNYFIAKEYFEKSAQLNNSEAFNSLGILYEEGLGVKQNYLMAKEYYQKSANMNNTNAINSLGYFYWKGLGVKQDYFKAIKYYKRSSQLNDSTAHFYLGYFYSTGDVIEKNIQKAMKYFLKSISIQRGYVIKNNKIHFEINNFRYISMNHLGLIYHIELCNYIKAINYIKESAFAEYPYGQNNYGLFKQFYLNDIEYAEYMYQRSSSQKFSLAEYNLGHLCENNNKIEESIKFYVQASNHEEEELLFRNIKCIDKRLEISKAFILCLTNLKLTEYYFSLSQYDQSKKYFIRSFKKLINNEYNQPLNYKFNFKLTNQILLNSNGKINKNLFVYLGKFIFNCQIFNLFNQPDLELKPIIGKYFLHDNLYIGTNHEEKKQKLIQKNNAKNNNKIKKLKETDEYYDLQSNFIKKHQNEIIFDEPEKLFDFIISNSNTKQISEIKTIFIEEIKNIIDLMNKILYTPPYYILFGRIYLEKQKPKKMNINNDFYEGFGIK